MTGDSHAEQARGHLERIDADGDPELAALRADAVAAVDAILAHRENTGEREPVTTDAPESWDDSEWEETVEAAREKAGIGAAKGTLTTKTIDDRDYYYLQWREGDKVKSQYIAPVDPA